MTDGAAGCDGYYLFAPCIGQRSDSLARHAWRLLHVTWSPDGGRIAYTTIGPGRDSSHRLRVIDVDTGRQRVLTPVFNAIHGIGPVWSPDGETIVYQRCTRSTYGGERHVAVLVTPGDLGDGGATPRKVFIPAPQVTVRGSNYHLYPYRVTWSPDGAIPALPSRGVTSDPEAVVVAVPTDPDRPPVVIALTEDVVA